ncbi:MAG: ABC transporter substrate-binding protein [Christensenellales bacterium]
MKNKIAVLLAVLMLLGALAGCKPAATPDASVPPAGTTDDAGTPTDDAADKDNPYDKSDKIVIAVVSSMTGERAQNGIFAKEAMDLWADQVNSEGGIIGKTVEVVYEDDQSLESSAANAYQKVLSRGDVNAVILSTFSAFTLAIEPYVLEYGVPTFTGGSSVKIPELKNDFLWQIRYSDGLAGVTMARASVQNLNMKKPALMHSTDSFGQGLADATKAELLELGIAESDILDLGYSVGEKNYAPMLAQIKDAGCDGLIAIGHQVEGSLIVSQVATAGLNLPLMGSTTFCSEIVIENAGEAANGWYSASDWTPTVQDEPGKSFVEEYSARYNRKPDLPSQCAYDSAILIKAAIEAGESADPKSINENIKQLKDVKGVASIYSPNADDHICATTQFLTKNIDGVAEIQELVTR